ncbi:MAG TPA: hypothetical protein VLB44_24335 [Kofleriaceae bacterium]|nr:hypothetical protein [Kofleriaceae bacterium]
MRRVGPWLGVAWMAMATAAHAGPWTVSGEAGTELDDNVQRVETGPGLDTTPVTAWVLRFGARVDHKAKALGGSYAFDLSDLTRIVSNDQVSVENVTALAGNARWVHALPDRPVLVGVSVTAIDALPLSDPTGARTFRNLGADALLALRGNEDRSLTLAFGARDFVYKPDHDFDWRGPSASARFDLLLWQPPSKTKSLELAATAGFEARTFETVALTNGCPPDSPPNPNCTASTDLERRDRYQRLGVELTWVGRQIAAVGYQLTLIDSNSFGQSLARHRGTVSGTVQLAGKWYATLLGILQLDQYLDGLVVRRDLQQQEFTDVDAENRSSIQLRIARKLTGDWAFEGRAAIWRNVGGGAMQLDFERELVYLGLVYGK